MAAERVVREVVVRGKVEGLDTVSTALDRLAVAEGRVAQGSEAMARAQATVERRQSSVASALDRELRKVDELYRGQQAFARSSATFDRALQQGRITVERHAEAVSLAARRYGVANDNLKTLGKSHELASHQVQNLRFQLQDVATSLAGGASPFQVLAQQGGQIASVFGPGQGGVLGILRGISQAIPRGLAIGGAVGAVAGLPLLAAEGYQREETASRRSLLGVGRGSGLTPTDLRNLDGPGREFAGGGGLSGSESRNLARTIAGTGYGSKESIVQARDMARDLAATLDESVPDLNKRFETLFRNPVQGADELNARLGFLTGGTRDFIKSLADQGRNTEAAEVAMRAMSGTLGKYGDLTSGLGKAYDVAKRGLSDWVGIMEKGGDRIVTSLSGLATKHEETAERVVRAEKRQTDAIKDQTEEQIRRIRDRAEVISTTLARDNLLARRDPLAQQVFAAQREAGVQPPLSDQDREAERGLSQAQRLERQRQADLISRQVTERNSIDLSKQFAEQARVSRMTLEGEAQAIGLAVKESERLRYEIAARIGASQGGKAISAEVEAQIKREAAAYGELTDTLARLRLKDQGTFDRSQLGRTSGEAQIASQIRSAGLGDMDDAANQAAVSQLRLNQTLAETKSVAKDSLSGLISDLKAGKSGAEAFSNALSRLSDRLTDKALDSALSSVFGLGTSNGANGGGAVAGLISAATRQGSSAAPAALASVPRVPVARVESEPLGVVTMAAGRVTGPTPRISGVGGTSALVSEADRSTLMAIGRTGGNPDLAQSNGVPIPPVLPRTPINPADLGQMPPAFAYGGRSIGSTMTDPAAESAMASALTRKLDGVTGAGADAAGKFSGRLAVSTDQATAALERLSTGVDASGNSLVESFQSLSSSVLSGGGGGSGGLGGVLGRLFGMGGQGSGIADASFGDGLGVFMANGGPVHGPGGPRSDSILARLSNGEYVINARSAAMHRETLDAINYGLPRYADGGPVALPPAGMMMPAPANTNVAAPVTYTPTYNITPAQGVTPAQLQPILDQHAQNVIKHVARNHGTMGAAWRKRAG